MTIINRDIARTIGLNKYYTGTPCVRGHDTTRWTKTAACTECMKESTTKWRTTNPNRAQHMERARKKQAQLRQTNLWYRASLLEGARRAQCRECVPAHYDRQACVEFYYKAVLLSMMTGIQYDVDHIIPVSKGGAHSAENLQVLRHIDNARKGNKIS